MRFWVQGLSTAKYTVLRNKLILFWYKCGLCIFVHELQENAQFKVRINEKGTRFSEKIKVNEKENTVRFMVPKHNDIDHSEVLNDFNLVNEKKYWE